MSDKRAGARSRNEGKGNTTAAREINEAERRFVEPGAVAEKAREAERAPDGPERQEAEQSEAVGESRAAPEDTEVSRSTDVDDDEIRRRAYEIWERAGRPEGAADDHWRQAEHDIKGQ